MASTARWHGAGDETELSPHAARAVAWEGRPIGVAHVAYAWGWLAGTRVNTGECAGTEQRYGILMANLITSGLKVLAFSAALAATVALSGGCASGSSSASLEYGWAAGRVASQKKLADALWAQAGAAIERGEAVDARKLYALGEFSIASRTALEYVMADLGGQRWTLSEEAKTAMNQMDAAGAKAAGVSLPTANGNTDK